MATVWDEIAALVHGAGTFHNMAKTEKNENERIRLTAKAERWLRDAEELRILETNERDVGNAV